MSVRIISDGTSRGTKIFVDGQPMLHVTRLKLDLSVENPQIAELTLRVVVDQIEIVDDDAIVERNSRAVAEMTDKEAAERALMALGAVPVETLRETLVKALAEVASR